MMLPDDLHRFSKDERELHARILAHVVSIDGVICREEMAQFEERMGDALIDPERRKVLRKILQRPEDLDELLMEMDPMMYRIVLRDAVIMAVTDGEFAKSEKQVIERIASHAKISKDKLSRLYAWVDRGLDWRVEGESILGLA